VICGCELVGEEGEADGDGDEEETDFVLRVLLEMLLVRLLLLLVHSLLLMPELFDNAPVMDADGSLVVEVVESTLEIFMSSSVDEDSTLVATSSSSSSPNSISTLAESSDEHEEASGDGISITAGSRTLSEDD